MENREGRLVGKHSKIPQKHKAQPFWWAWLTILLLPVTFLLPIWGEELQVKLIGYEGFCCHPDNWEELEQKAQQAKNMRLDSNLIIGTSVLLAVALLIGIIFILYKYAVPCIKIKWLRRTSQIVIGILASPFALLLLLAAIMLVFHNDEYHKTRYQPPRDTIYSYAVDLVMPHSYWNNGF